MSVDLFGTTAKTRARKQHFEFCIFMWLIKFEINFKEVVDILFSSPTNAISSSSLSH